MKKILYFFIFAQLLFSCGDDVVKPIDKDPIVDNLYPELVEKYKIHKSGLNLESVYIGDDKSQIILNGRIDEKLWIAVYDTETTEQLYEWTDKQKLEMLITTKDANGVLRDYEIGKYEAKDFYIHNSQLYFTLWGTNPKTVQSEDKLLYVPFYIIKDNTLIKRHLSYGLPSFTESVSYEGNIYKKITSWHNGTYIQYASYRQGDPKLHVFFSSNGEMLFTIDNEDKIIEQSEPIHMEEVVVLHSERLVPPNYYFSRVNFKSGQTIWEADKKPFEDLPNTAKMESQVITKTDNIWSYVTVFTTIDGDEIERQIELNIETGELTY